MDLNRNGKFIQLTEFNSVISGHLIGMFSIEFSTGILPETRWRVIAEILLLQINPIFGWADNNIEMAIKPETKVGIIGRQCDRL